jgi:hypothetical protein
MSDHPIAPVAAHEPPYYAVVFTSRRTAGDDGYGEVAKVEQSHGFVKGQDQEHDQDQDQEQEQEQAWA